MNNSVLPWIVIDYNEFKGSKKGYPLKSTYLFATRIIQQKTRIIYLCTWGKKNLSTVMFVSLLSPQKEHYKHIDGLWLETTQILSSWWKEARFFFQIGSKPVRQIKISHSKSLICKKNMQINVIFLYNLSHFFVVLYNYTRAGKILLEKRSIKFLCYV